jgi:hypothetical protein
MRTVYATCRSKQCRIVSRGIGGVTVDVSNALKPDLMKLNLRFGIAAATGVVV